MNDERWPDELSALEVELQGLPAAVPVAPAALRERVLGAIERERSVSVSRTSAWWFAACTAAAAMLWINVSISVIHEDGRNWRRSIASPTLPGAEEQVRKLAPELAPLARGYVLSLRSGSQLPRSGNLPRGKPQYEEIE